MSVADVVNEGWGRHEDDPEGVLASVNGAILEASMPDDVLQLANLGCHVAGTHLGRWNDGRALLEALREKVEPDSPADRALWRQAAVLALAADEEWEPLLERGATVPPESGRIRVLAMGATSLVEHDTARAGKLLREALVLSDGLDAADPAARSLAVASNNLACELEERPSRTPEDDALLEQAAHSSRTWWERVGTWNNVYLAEYRLAHTYIALGRPDEAERHAAEALRLCEANAAEPGDLFFAHEAVAKAAHAQALVARELAAAQLTAIEDEGLRQYCEGELAKLDAQIGRSEPN